MTGWLPSYRRAWLRADVSAGVTLAAFAVPGSLAYASLAGLPPQAGLYCYMLAGIAYALFGTSRQAAVGPTSAMSILVGATLGGLALGDPARYGALAALTAVLVAGISLTAWTLRLGQVVHFISETVLTGFKAGVALQIASTQLPKLFGIKGGGDGFFGRTQYLIAHLDDTHAMSLAVGGVGLLLLVAGERLLPRRPIVLLVVALSIVMTSVTGLAAQGVAVLGQVPAGFPSLGLGSVTLSDVSMLLPLSLACFLLSYVETVSVVRTFALTHGYPVNADQELLALGAANLAVGLGQGYPVAGGMSQSAVNDKAGARTQVAIVVTSVVVGLVLVFFSGVFANLPSAILAAVVLVAVKGLVNVRELRHLHRVSRPDFRVAMVALTGVLAFGILNGVLLAAIMSLLMLIRRAARPHTAVLGRIPGTTQFGDVERHPTAESSPDLLVYRVYGGIVYFNVEHVEGDLRRLLRSRERPVTRVIFDLSSSPVVDLAGVRMLESLHEQLTATGIMFELAEARGAVRDLLQAEGVTARSGLIDPSKSLAALCGA